MEKKTTKSNKLIPLIINLIKGKKSWFLVSAVIIFVTTLLIPYILKADEETFIVFGIVETFIIIFINCMIDNSFLHNDSKLAYYKSKPVTMKTQIAVGIFSNIIFAGFLLALLAISIVIQGLVDSNILESFKFIIPWLAVGILLASLSSVLTGNTIMAAAMTIFNFALPAIIYLIIMFVFTILENAVVGFSADVLLDYFVNTVYKLEYIYFFGYIDKSVDFIYIVLLAGILIGISLITLNCIKRRKNENTGNFIVFDGYKYFVSVLASLIVPAAFSVMSYENSIVNKVIVSAIMSVLAYYIIIAVMEKSFKISKLSIKVFTLSMVLFVVTAGGTVAFANQYKNVVPNAEDVKFAYIGSNKYVFTGEEWNNVIKSNIGEIDLNENFLNWQRENRLVIFTERESIENITDLHQELLSNPSYKIEEDYYYSNNLVVAYLMNDGSFILRDYKMNASADNASDNQKKDEIAFRVLNSQEMKECKYYYLYDEKYYNNSNIYCYVANKYDGSIIVDNIKLGDIRNYLIKDIDKQYSETDSAFGAILSNNFEKQTGKELDNSIYYLEIIDRSKNKEADLGHMVDEIILYDEFTNSLEYLKLN